MIEIPFDAVIVKEAVFLMGLYGGYIDGDK